jgi:hypothetical protein
VLHVDDDVDEVEQHPAALAGALTAGRLAAALAQLLLDLVHDGLHLAFVGRRRDHEAVRDGQLVGHVEHDDVLGLLVGGRGHRHPRQRERFVGRRHRSPSRRTDRSVPGTSVPAPTERPFARVDRSLPGQWLPIGPNG